MDFLFGSEVKNTKRTNLVGVDEKSSDICRGSPLPSAEWVYHHGIYEWPQVCRRREAGTPSLLSDVTPVQVCAV